MTQCILFNALSVSNLSGRHVLLGHIEQLSSCDGRSLEPVIYHRRHDRTWADALGGRVECVEASAGADHWFGRRAVEAIELPGLIRRMDVRVLFQPDGLLAPINGVKQWVLAQNPWCFFPQYHQGSRDRVKAWLQRRAYAQAQRSADIMFFNSRYMAAAYKISAGCEAKDARILYQGVAADAFELGERKRSSFSKRRLEIVVVSAMAPHKNIEAVVRCLALLHEAGVKASLKLVGGWPNLAYRSRIEAQVAKANLTGDVFFIGHVERSVLLDHYAQARVFCLLSRCESFGIPSVEAQACGTPTVVAHGTAAPEVAGPGGSVVEQDDDAATVNALLMMLTDEMAWSMASSDALANATRFRWPNCSKPLLNAIDQCAGSGGIE